MNNQKQAFTLVELIVVITILAILSTIWFVSYSSYLAWTRDTNRISQLKSISEWLHLYSTNHTLPKPDDSIDINVNWTTIAYQWYAWANTLETITYSTEWIDPKDKTFFSYYLTRDRKHFQLMAFLEEEDNLQNQATAIDYTKRHPTVFWAKLWILTDTDNNPVQEVVTTELDIATTTTNYIARFKDSEELLQWTWSVLTWISSNASCKRLYDIEWKRKSWTYTIYPDWINWVWVYCDMENNGWWWTRTHLLKYDALSPTNDLVWYKWMFISTDNYWDNWFRTDISKINYNEFVYLTDTDKRNVEYLSSWTIRTVWYKNEGFSDWIEVYTFWSCWATSCIYPRWNWYYYETLDKKVKETLWFIDSWYRNMWWERLLYWNNWVSWDSRTGTNFPFWKQWLATSWWCVWWKNQCINNHRDWASLWIR